MASLLQEGVRARRLFLRPGRWRRKYRPNSSSGRAAPKAVSRVSPIGDLVFLPYPSFVLKPNLYRLASRLFCGRPLHGSEIYGMARPFGQPRYCCWRFEGREKSDERLQFSELILARTAAASWGWMVRARSSNGGACGQRVSLGSLKACRRASSQWRPAAAPIILAVFSRRKATRFG